MNTAIALRRFAPRGTLLHGAIQRIVPTRNGDVGILAAGELAIYLVETPGLRRLFLFRTLHRVELAEARIPGVWPTVRLLATFNRSGRIDRIESLLAYLDKQQRAPTSLSDSFWLRVGYALSGRLPKHKILLSLLASEKQIESTNQQERRCSHD